MDPKTLSLPYLYSSIAGYFPTAAFSQFNTRSDTVQTFFYVLSKGSISATDATDWSAKMVANVEQTSATTPTFRAYLAPGTDHCIINKASFYTQTVSGKKFCVNVA